MKQSLPISTLAALLVGIPLFAALPPDVYPTLQSGGQLDPCVAEFLGKDPRPWTLPVDTQLIQKRHNFGYSSEEIQKYFSRPLRMTLDEGGLDRSYLKPAPATGIHPRVIFNPEDLPAIRQRLATDSGKAVMGDIRAHIAEVLTGPKAKFAADYDKLVKGDQTVDINRDRDIPYTLMYEAFRCLVDNDTAGGRKTAAAFTTIAQIADKELDANIAKEKARFEKAKLDYARKNNVGSAPEDSSNDFRVVAQGPTLEGTLGLDYDFAFNWMTNEQRGIVRKTLVKGSAGMTNIGCETLRSLHAGTSNWVSWSNRLIFVITAIENEPGYDASTYHRCEDAQINFISSMYPTGEGFEGWGKNFMFIEHMVIMGKRGKDLLAIAPVRAAYNDYFISALDPWGNAFTFCDSLGGSDTKIARNADVVMYHALFPRDISGDFIYRNQISGDYANIIPGARVNTHHPFAVMDALCCALFVTDLLPLDVKKEYAEVTNGRPFTYFSEDTCNMMTRSAWNKDALYLNYLTRAIPGGHQYCDRSHFSLYGLGRYWSIYHVMRQIHEQYGPANRSVLLADDEGPSVMEGRCVNFTDKPLATFTATDLSADWDYQTAGLVKPPKGVETVQNPFSYNDFRLHPSPIPWMALPIGELPDWYTSEKPDPRNKADWYKRPVQVTKAFRTAGLVRGAHPYSLIVDDLQKDAQPHKYDWGMILADDLTLGSSKVTGAADRPQADVILNESPKADPKATAAPETDRHLLVRVLAAAQLDPNQFATVGAMSVPNPPQKEMRINKLHITSQSVSPEFKMLLYPFKEGQPLPVTTWSADHRAVVIAWPDQSDKVTFLPGKDGRTRIGISRNGSEVISVD